MTWERSAEYGVCGRDELATEVAVAAAAKVTATRGALGGESPQVLVVGDVAGITTSSDSVVVLQPLEMRAECLVCGQDKLLEPGEGPAGRRLTEWLLSAGKGVSPRVVTGGLQSETATGDERPGDPGSPEAVVPIYVRPPDADVHIKKMRDPFAANSRSQG
ncbi:MAG: hypothetical protein H5T84_04235 [Thermoleophilia bacterium]|nr:hypothetical protein [Thermoleophilia bacterium]